MAASKYTMANTYDIGNDARSEIWSAVVVVTLGVCGLPVCRPWGQTRAGLH